MTLQPHEQRVVDEKRDLDERLTKLEAFIATPGTPFEGLDIQDRALLRAQRDTMQALSRILEARINRFSVKTGAAPAAQLAACAHRRLLQRADANAFVIMEYCQDCGATRTNRDGPNGLEHGPWSAPTKIGGAA